MMTFLLIPALLLMTSISSMAQGVVVELSSQNIALKYDAPVRLEQVLLDVRKHVDSPIYELASNLSLKHQTVEQKNLFDKTVNDLKTLAKSQPESGADSVLAQLKGSKFYSRFFISLDLDVVQTQTKQNPQLQGEYQLHLIPRPDTITLFGLLQNQTELPFIAHATLDEYLDKNKSALLSNANPSLAYVIQPDGEVQEVPYDYWNYTPSYFSPGAIVFIAFDSLPNQYQHLNAAIIELLRNKANK